MIGPWHRACMTAGTMSRAPTYCLCPSGAPPERYLEAVARCADQVVAAGEALRPIVEAYAAFVELGHCEERLSHTEYLVEALVLGVLWRTRGHDAVSRGPRANLVDLLACERRTRGRRRRDGTTARLLSLGVPFRPATLAPTLADVRRLFEWLLASGEYDDEVARLAGWERFLSHEQDSADERLRSIVGFAQEFEVASERALGRYTTGVDRFVAHELAGREAREDTIQCSRRRTEYHLNMVCAELLNRAWRAAFLACRRHVVMLPGCARKHPNCRALGSGAELRCRHCTVGCAVSTATRVAERASAEAVVVRHGSDSSRFLRSLPLGEGDIGVVGVACVPGLVGAGWRARATGLPAQCVLLESSGCSHWLERTTPTAFDLGELGRILDRSERTVSRVA
jgi:hypothetical protein